MSKAVRKFRSYYNGPRFRVAVDFTGQQSLTKQSFADECDINVLMSRYQSGAILPGNALQATYGDVSAVTDYQDALNLVIEANDGFNNLPSKVRSYFDNDPAQFLAFVGNSENIPEMIKLGIYEPSSPPSAGPTAPAGGGDPSGSDKEPSTKPAQE
nr:MAG: internal scaffolding protein [Microvirus sp.]